MKLSKIPFSIFLSLGLISSPAVYGQNQIIKLPGLAAISAEQIEKLKSALVPKIPDVATLQAIQEATSSLFPFLRIQSCMVSGAGASQLNAYAAPNKNFEYAYHSGPIKSTDYHDKSVCVTVLRTQDWQMPAKNALKFEVVYVSDISGESVKKRHELVKQVSGEWLFTQ